jgi:hypothetical protein
MRRSFIRAFLVGSAVLSASVLVHSQTHHSYRESFGEPRATLMEALVAALYPSKPIAWDPSLLLTIAPAQPRQVQFPAFTFKAVNATTLQGATGVEIGDTKGQTIFRAHQSGRAPETILPTTLVVFEATIDGRITRFKDFSLNSSNDLLELKLLQVPDFPSGVWPTLHIQYMSYPRSFASHVQIEWQASFDANTAKFIMRVPIAIVDRSIDGSEQTHMLTVGRIDPSTISIADTITGKSIRYSCPDPCLVDAPSFVALWVK